MAFLLDSGASISVPSKLTYMMITRICEICTLNQHDKSNSPTTANQFEVPINQKASLNCFSSMETK